MQDARIGRLAVRRSQAVREREELRDTRKAIIDLAQEQGLEDLSPEGDAEFRKLTAKIQRYDGDINDFDERIGELTEDEERRTQVTEGGMALQRAQGRALGGGQAARLPLPCDLGEEQMRTLFDAMRSNTPARVESRATISGLGGIAVAPQLVGADYLNLPRVASLFSTQGTESPTVRVYVATTAATAGVVAEGAAKPDAGLALTPKDVDMEKIATRAKLSMEMMQDFPAFVSAIAGELTRAVVAKENSELVTALLAASLTGQTSAGEDGIDATAEAIATLQADGIEPTAVVMSPARLAAIRSAKASTAGSYIVDPTQAGPAGLHGYPVTVAPQLDADTVLVGRFIDAGTLYVRESVSIRIGYDADDFSKNLQTVIAEERVGLAVTQPARIVKIDLSEA